MSKAPIEDSESVQLQKKKPTLSDSDEPEERAGVDAETESDESDDSGDNQ